MKTDPEQTLRQMRWRDPPPEFLKHTLEIALAESRQLSGASRESNDARKRHLFAWLAFIPRPLRLPLAACWLLAFFFRITTPEAVPAATLENYAKLPPMTPAQLVAHIEHVEHLAHELLEQLRGPIPPL